MTQPDPWQAPDPASTGSAQASSSAAPWTATGTAPAPPPQPYPPPWPGPFAPPPPRQPMSRRNRTLLIVGAVVVALLLIAGAAALGVLVARDAANDDESTLFPTLDAELVSDLDRLDEDAPWTETDTLSGASLDSEWAARLYSSSMDTTRAKDLLASMLQEDGYEHVTVTEYLEPRDVDYDYEVSGSREGVYAIGYVGSEILYEYEDDGTAVDVEAPAGGSAITIRLSVTSSAGD